MQLSLSRNESAGVVIAIMVLEKTMARQKVSYIQQAKGVLSFTFK